MTNREQIEAILANEDLVLFLADNLAGEHAAAERREAAGGKEETWRQILIASMKDLLSTPFADDE